MRVTQLSWAGVLVEFVGEVEVTSAAEALAYFRGPDGYLHAL